MTFEQETDFYKDNVKQKTQLWFEASSSPGNLIIKFDSMRSHSGALFKGDSSYSFRPGNPMKRSAETHDLMLIGFDVYFIKPDSFINKISSLGYNTEIFREDTFSGRQVFVVGAHRGDSISRQFWIDKERLYLHRIIYMQGKDKIECTLENYRKIKKYWVSTVLTFKVNSDLKIKERYKNIKFPSYLPADIFDPEKFNNAMWY